MASVVLMATGLLRATFFGHTATPGFVEDARVGGLFMLAGSVASIAAAVWSFLRGHPHWVTACVAAPAVLLGGYSLLRPYTLDRHIVALIALPAALAGIVGGLIDRGYRRVR
ncbi:hypothetical protein ACX801_07980 [Arthrobacter bambusae]